MINLPKERKVNCMKPIIGTTKQPADRGNYRYDWEAAAQRCREQPGEWVLIYEDIPHSAVTSIPAGRIKHLPTDQFQYRTDNTHHVVGVTNGRRCDLYLRHIAGTKEKN